MDISFLSIGIILMLIVDVAVIIITILICRKYLRSFLNKYSEDMGRELEKYKDELENQNRILTNELSNTIKSQEEHMQNYRHLEKQLFNTFIKIKQSIKIPCYNTSSEIGATRLAIYLFHNGTSSTHGLSFIKMSCICEKVAIGSGVKERLMEHSNIPINLFDDMIENLSDNGQYIVINDDNSTTSDTIKRLFISSNKIKYALLVSIFDNDNNILGFVSVEMMNTYSREKCLKEKDIVEELINQIRPVLMFSDYKNITLETNMSNNVQHD